MSKKKEQEPIIIKKAKKNKHSHYGGAWKVAYADFVTAMMAFFLLMWLLNSTSEEQKRGISNYFGPVGLATGQSGSGGLLGGVSISSEEVISDSTAAPAIALITPESLSESGENDAENDMKEASEEEPIKNEVNPLSSMTPEELDVQKVAETYEEKQLRKVEKDLKKVLEALASKEGLSDNIIIEMTPEGLRIQLVDQQKKSMFPLGSDNMYPLTEKILSKVAEIIQNVPNKIAISGHTDAKPFSNSARFGNWELSAQRANAARRVIKKTGIPDGRMSEVVGKASTDLFNKDDPNSPQNRRISILLLKSGAKRDSFANQLEDSTALSQEAESQEVGSQKAGSQEVEPQEAGKKTTQLTNTEKTSQTDEEGSVQKQQEFDISFMYIPKPVTDPWNR